jgi:phytoene/squalene synthetase
MGQFQGHLDQVSRSFAFCIRELNQPLQDWVACSYLLCRMADTIEDYQWPSVELQESAFNEFKNLLNANGPIDAQSVAAWTAQFPKAINKGERELLADAFSIFHFYWNLPTGVRDAICRNVLNMVRGMQHFTSKGVVKLGSLKETNEYCFFVAGVIGELLTDLVAFQEVNSETSLESFIYNGFHFGLFLQKVNILKDQLSDEVEGRFLVPSRAELLASLWAHARLAFQYIEMIPRKLDDYKVFCSWSLFLGLASLPYIQRAFVERKKLKISRIETFVFLSQVKSFVGKPAQLRELFEQKLSEVFPSHTQVPAIASVSELRGQWRLAKLYDGRLREEDFVRLGLVQEA